MKRGRVANRRLALQTQAAQAADAHLTSRLKEIFGNDQAIKLADAPEVSLGMSAAIVEAEGSRNAELSQLNLLRHDVDAAYRNLTRLLNENRTPC